MQPAEICPHLVRKKQAEWTADGEASVPPRQILFCFFFQLVSVCYAHMISQNVVYALFFDYWSFLCYYSAQ